MRNALKSIFVAAMFALSTSANASLIIYSTDFASTSGWSDSDFSNGVERYNAGGAGARGMLSTYDHDNDPQTPNISIFRALEVNDDAGPVTLFSPLFTINEFVAPWITGTVSFFAGERGNGSASSAWFELKNVTKEFSLTGQIAPVVDGRNWVFNTFNFGWGGSEQGDELQLVFFGGGSGSASGLQITDASVTTVSEPSVLGLLGMGLIVAVMRRRRK